jgi:predicted nucleic acid-binding protein
LIFVDTGAWVALSVPGDRHGTAARALYADVARGVYGRPVTTDFVLDEAATLIRMATDVEIAVRFVRTVLGSSSVTVVWIDPERFVASLERLEGHADKRWSFTDCTSFAVMDDLGIDAAFAFDRNFEEAGLTRLP